MFTILISEIFPIMWTAVAEYYFRKEIKIWVRTKSNDENTGRETDVSKMC
jgi:hypothetical protein